MTKFQDELRAAIISYFYGQRGEACTVDIRWQKLESLIERCVDIDSIATEGGFMSVTSKHRLKKQNDK